MAIGTYFVLSSAFNSTFKFKAIGISEGVHLLNILLQITFFPIFIDLGITVALESEVIVKLYSSFLTFLIFNEAP